VAEQNPPDRGPYRPARQVCERYQITDRTLDRWLADPKIGFPRPLTINRRRYFSDPELTTWERKRAAAA
jgi:predicted DNA-binding transcriptional regulator AlpA